MEKKKETDNKPWLEKYSLDEPKRENIAKPLWTFYFWPTFSWLMTFYFWPTFSGLMTFYFWLTFSRLMTFYFDHLCFMTSYFWPTFSGLMRFYFWPTFSYTARPLSFKTWTDIQSTHGYFTGYRISIKECLPILC